MVGKNKIARAGGRSGKREPARRKPPLASTSNEGQQVRSNASRLRPGGRAVLDERVPVLLLDAISSVNAAIVSAIVRLPYIEVRQAIAADDEQKRELTLAIQGVAEKYRCVFTENKAAIEFGVAWAGVHAAHFDNFLARPDGPEEQPALLLSEALFLAALVLAPLLILVVVSIVQNTRRE
jgi:hypothetical protein